MIFFTRKKIFFNVKVLVFCILFGLHNNLNFAKQLNLDNVPNQSYLKRTPQNDYILGEGDQLMISIVKEIEELNVEVVINASGTITLPRVNRIYVSGLTINELQQLLVQEYRLFIKEPNIQIEILEHRPVRVFVGGEVEKPGLITIPGSFVLSDQPYNNNKPFSNDYYFPSVYDAIRKAGGVNYYSDLSNIEVIRINNLSNGGGQLKTELDFMQLLNGTNPSVNVRVYDGDYINIKTSKSPVLSQISKAIRTNLNPEFISVNVSGRVETPGMLKMKKSSTLNDAVYMSGGLRATRGKINFVRIDKDGNLDRRKFAFKKSAQRGSYKNPFLQPGDLIYVGKSGFNIANEIITDITLPFVGLYGTGKFFDLID
tara:strand:- start:624 stop:1736 length:1113 start_codon:yes stop_codon:yes gene_type:complete